jgi:hypothetical protein
MANLLKIANQERNKLFFEHSWSGQYNFVSRLASFLITNFICVYDAFEGKKEIKNLSLEESKNIYFPVNC